MLLVYVTGGVAAAHFRDSWADNNFVSNTTRASWVGGGGIEYMLMPNWTIRFEGMYSDFGNWAITSPQTCVGAYRSSFAHTVALFRGGFNFKW